MSARLARTVSVDEVAQVLGISRNHAFRCVHSGEIPSVRMGRRLLIPVSFLESVLEPTAVRAALDPRSRSSLAGPRIT